MLQYLSQKERIPIAVNQLDCAAYEQLDGLVHKVTLLKLRLARCRFVLPDLIYDVIARSRRRSQDFWLGGAQTANYMQWRHQKFSKKELFVGHRYRRMEDLKSWSVVT